MFKLILIFIFFSLLFGNVLAAFYRVGEYMTDNQIVVEINNADGIQAADSILAGERGEPMRWQINGILVKETACYNPGWSFHYDPDTISFGQLHAEVSDASFPYLEEHIDEAGGSFLPDSRWCPWGSYLLNEEQEINC